MLDEIIQSATKVGEMISQIAGTAAQQATAVAEVTANIELTSKISSASKSGAERAVRGCDRLKELAEQMREALTNFSGETETGSIYQPQSESVGHVRLKTASS